MTYSHGQARSIRGLLKGQFDVAAISDDSLQQMLAENKITASDYRLIYESQVIRPDTGLRSLLGTDAGQTSGRGDASFGIWEATERIRPSPGTICRGRV